MIREREERVVVATKDARHVFEDAEYAIDGEHGLARVWHDDGEQTFPLVNVMYISTSDGS